MPRRPKAYLRPKNIDEALKLLSEPGTVALAGGAHLLATEADIDAETAVDLQDAGLSDITIDETTGGIAVGATAKLIDLWEFLQEARLPGELPTLLQQAIRYAGPNTYRNAATLGGIIASRLPDSELLAALLVADATVALRLPRPETVSLAAYVGADTRPSGLITAVHIPVGPGRAAAERVARTPADYPIVSITGWLPNDGFARLAATGISPRPIRLLEAEAAVAPGLSDVSIDAAASAAQSAAVHPGDFRGDGAYRAEMAAVLVRRTLRQLAAG